MQLDFVRATVCSAQHCHQCKRFRFSPELFPHRGCPASPRRGGKRALRRNNQLTYVGITGALHACCFCTNEGKRPDRGAGSPFQNRRIVFVSVTSFSSSAIVFCLPRFTGKQMNNRFEGLFCCPSPFSAGDGPNLWRDGARGSPRRGMFCRGSAPIHKGSDHEQSFGLRCSRAEEAACGPEWVLCHKDALRSFFNGLIPTCTLATWYQGPARIGEGKKIGLFPRGAVLLAEDRQMSGPRKTEPVPAHLRRISKGPCCGKLSTSFIGSRNNAQRLSARQLRARRMKCGPSKPLTHAKQRTKEAW